VITDDELEGRPWGTLSTPIEVVAVDDLLSDEAIERAARTAQRIFEETADDPSDIRPWDSEDLDDADREAYRADARRVLRAALGGEETR